MILGEFGIAGFESLLAECFCTHTEKGARDPGLGVVADGDVLLLRPFPQDSCFEAVRVGEHGDFRLIVAVECYR
ncbi:hypothetical protein BXO91_27160 (plasmid) [Rhodococcus qingshengii]|nr:hypothetical protein BXO91_27160 [Rhodococcus qingshengii]